MGELIVTFDNYTIYKSYIDTNESYYLCVPKGNITRCQIYLGFLDVNTDAVSKDEIISMISGVNDLIMKKNASSVYVVPNIPDSLLDELALENDDLIYKNFLVQKIQPIMTAAYNILVNNGINPKNINSAIKVIEKNERDQKVASWFAMLLGDSFIKELDEELNEKKMNNNGHKIKAQRDENGFKYSHQEQENFDTGIAPVNHQNDEMTVNNKRNEKKLVKTPPREKRELHGFSSFKFIITTLLFSLVVGVSIGYLLMK